MSKMFRLMIFLFLFVFASAALAQEAPDWTNPFPPYRIIGNIYYVGSQGLAAYLITTPQGNILINDELAKQSAAAHKRLFLEESLVDESCSAAQIGGLL